MVVVDWLNDNGGFVMAVLTIVYVVATWVIVASSRRSNQLAAAALKLSSRIEERRTRPLVFFDFESLSGDVYIVVRNIGPSPALNVRVELTPAIERTRENRPWPVSMLSQTIRILAPGRACCEFIDYGRSFYEKNGDNVFTGTVGYEDANGTSYSESFRIPVADTREMVYASGNDVAEELRAISSALHGMRFR